MVRRQFSDVLLILADCLDVLPEIACDAVVTDPPYGIKNLSQRRARIGTKGKQLRNPITVSDGLKYRRHEGIIIGDSVPFDPSPWLRWPCVMWGAGYYHERLPRGGWLLWDKKCTGGYEGWDGGDGDMAWMTRQCAPRVFRMVWMGVARGEVEKANGGQNKKSAHPNQKPVALMAWSMEQARIPSTATVCDPYMGSGTTAIACIRTGRKFVGIEKDVKHFETACERVANELAQGVLLPPNDKLRHSPSERKP
jgi:16S rRNA G966 N2-methylase RsmD